MGQARPPSQQGSLLMGQRHTRVAIQGEGMEEVSTRDNGPREQGLWGGVIRGSQREARKEEEAEEEEGSLCQVGKTWAAP